MKTTTSAGFTVLLPCFFFISVSISTDLTQHLPTGGCCLYYQALSAEAFCSYT